MFYRENVFDVVLFAASDDVDTRMVMLGHDFDVCCLPSVLSQMRKLNVTLRG